MRAFTPFLAGVAYMSHPTVKQVKGLNRYQIVVHPLLVLHSDGLKSQRRSGSPFI